MSRGAAAAAVLLLLPARARGSGGGWFVLRRFWVCGGSVHQSVTAPDFGHEPCSLTLFPCRRQDVIEGDYSELLASSIFCLVLPGDGWSARMDDAMLHGCIPVIIMVGGGKG